MEAGGDTKFYKAVKEFGQENFFIELLESIDNPTKEEADTRERHHISLNDSCFDGYNSDEGGVGGVLEHTQETKDKIRQASTGANNGMYGRDRTGDKNGMYGKTQSQETKDKISAKAKGNQRRLGAVLSQESKDKIGQANTGRLKGVKRPARSEDWSNNISESKKGKPVLSRRKTYKITYPTGEEVIVTGLMEYCKQNKLNPGSMSQLATGKIKKHKGFKCEFLES
jgi:group I intron endonuclease